MPDSPTYNIPASRIDAYRGRRAEGPLPLVLRSRYPEEIVACLSEGEVADLAYVQLLSATAEVDDLIHWGAGVPVDVVLQDPATEFPLLYRFARLLENHPVRITVPVVAGFSKAVKLAMSLNFAVKLEIVEQPGAERIEELSALLDFYLHRPTVAMPVEWFHSLLLGYCASEPVTLFSVQEEDPAHFRTITEAGEEAISSRYADLHGETTGTLAEGPPTVECAGCEFLEPCGGYFKWPHREYSCEGVKTLFRTLKDAAAELRADLDAFSGAQGELSR